MPSTVVMAQLSAEYKGSRQALTLRCSTASFAGLNLLSMTVQAPQPPSPHPTKPRRPPYHQIRCFATHSLRLKAPKQSVYPVWCRSASCCSAESPAAWCLARHQTRWSSCR
eukprot:scaffold3643_cov267-Pinguiococcus_pyrenoidosus.AAC.4